MREAGRESSETQALNPSANRAGWSAATPGTNAARAMRIHMGIMCERCRKVHFIATSIGIKPLLAREMYTLVCRFCSETREFRKENMQPYRVSEEAFRSGHATEGEYEFVQATKPPPQAR